MKIRCCLILLLMGGSSVLTIPESNTPQSPARALDLETSIRIALERSKELRYLGFDQRLARERYKLGIRRFLPSLTLGYIQSDSVSYDSPDSRLRKASLGLSQLLYDGGKLARSYRYQRHLLQINAMAIQVEKEDLIFSVIGIYTDILKFRLKKEIQQETYVNARKQLLIAEEEYQLGIITELDLLDIRLQIADLEIELEETAQQERLLLYDYCRLLGYARHSPPRPAGQLNEQYAGFISFKKPVGEQAERYLQSARRNNVEFMEKRLQLVKCRENWQASKRAWLPEITANLELSMAGESLPLYQPGFSLGLDLDFDLPVAPISSSATLGTSNPKERSRGISVSTAAAENLEALYSIKIARLELSRAGAELQQLETELAFELEESLVSVRNRKNTLELLRRKYAIGEARLEVEKLRVELGELKRVDLVSDQIELAQGRIEIIEKAVELYNSEIALLHRAGITGLIQTHSYLVLGEDTDEE
jgi:outer membrane protein TolC